MVNLWSEIGTTVHALEPPAAREHAVWDIDPRMEGSIAQTVMKSRR
jgi:hypothetical protein